MSKLAILSSMTKVAKVLMVAALFLVACDVDDPATPDYPFCAEQGALGQECCPTFAVDSGCVQGLVCRPSLLTGEEMCLFPLSTK